MTDMPAGWRSPEPMTRDDAQQATCPTCNADPGTDCTRIDTRQGACHVERYWAAYNAEDNAPA
jgi:hypothetical protein